MNKFKMVFFSLLLTLVLTGCGSTDETAPVFGAFVDRTVEYGSYFDLLDGVTATDDVDGDVTDLIECDTYDPAGDQEFDTEVTNVYTQICTVTDTAGNSASVERTITVLDEMVGAVISGVEDMNVSLDSYYNPMTNLEIIDKKDGFITEDVTIEIYILETMEQVGEIDTSYLDSYYVDYSIRNSLDIETTLRITVSVVDDEGPVISAEDLLFNNSFLPDLSTFATADDAYEGPISEISFIVYDEQMNMIEDYGTKPISGDYYVEYSATDSFGNIGTLVVSLHIVDFYRPEVTLETINYVVFTGDGVDLDSNLNIYDYSDELIENEVDVEYTITDVVSGETVTSVGDEDYGLYAIFVIVTDGYGNEEQLGFYLSITTGVLNPYDLGDYEARSKLEEFYEGIGYTMSSQNDICEYYVGHIDQGVINFNECTNGVNLVSGQTSSVTVGTTTSYVSNGVKYFSSEVVFNRSYENVTRTVEYHFESYEHTNYPYIVFDSDPFDLAYDVIERHPEYDMVDNELIGYYAMLYRNTGVSYSLVCDMYVLVSPYNSMTSSECVEHIEQERAAGLDMTIISYSAKSGLHIGGETYDGYEAVLEVVKDGFTQQVTVEFVFLSQGPEDFIQFIDGEFGPDYVPYVSFENLGLSLVATELIDFYETFLDPTVMPTELCNDYILISPFHDYNLEGCIDYVEHIRTVATNVTPVVIANEDISGLGGIIEGYQVELTFSDQTGSQNAMLYLSFIEIDGEYYPVFIEPEMFNLRYEQELDFASLSNRTYSAYINEFYDDVVNKMISNQAFYDKYFLTGGLSNAHLSYTEASTIRTNLNKNTYHFTVNSITYSDSGASGISPSYQTNVTRGVLTHYDINFYFYYDIYGDLILRVHFDDALGGGFK